MIDILSMLDANIFSPGLKFLRNLPVNHKNVINSKDLLIFDSSYLCKYSSCFKRSTLLESLYAARKLLLIYCSELESYCYHKSLNNQMFEIYIDFHRSPWYGKDGAKYRPLLFKSAWRCYNTNCNQEWRKRRISFLQYA